MLALIPQSGDFSGAALGVRSVALLQVAKLVGHFSYTKGILRVYKRSVLEIWLYFCYVFLIKLAYFLHISKKNTTFAPDIISDNVNNFLNNYEYERS